MMRSNNTRIEETATTALKACLLRCPILASYIDTNDKTPSWDGNIFVYKNGTQKKEDFLGKAPIQVKGTTKVLRGETATYSYEVADLKNYYKDGGCIFFLISMNLDTGEAIIYYSSLLVFDLKKIIDRAKTQTKIKIELNKFPQDDINEMASIFLSFVDNKQKQSSFIEKEFVSLSELQSRGVGIDKLSFNTSGLGLNAMNIGDFITSHEFYLYAKPKGLDVEIPVDKISNLIVSRQITGKVIVNGTEYYSSYAAVSKQGQSWLQFGKGLTALLDNEKRKISFNFSPSGTLSDFIHDAECFIAIAEYQNLSINGIALPIEGPLEFDLTKQKKSLQYFRDVKRMLDALGVNEELQCEELSKKDEINILNFVNAVLYGSSIKFLDATDSAIYGSFKVANLSIWIWANRKADGSYVIENFFTPHQIVMFESDDIANSNPIAASQYLLMNKEAFIHTSNINYESVKNDITLLTPHPLLANGVILLVLDIIRAYDEQQNKDDKLLDLADAICDWLSNPENQVDYPVIRLNKLQIIKRKRDLDVKEIVELSQYTDKSYPSNIRCGAYLILGDLVLAQQCFDEMEIDAQNEFIMFPICHFGNLRRSEVKN